MGDKTPVILSILTKFAKILPGLVSPGAFVFRNLCLSPTADAFGFRDLNGTETV
jgi:hypothetical protein